MSKKDVSLATFKLYNLQLGGKNVYVQKMTDRLYAEKVAWSGAMLKNLDADVIAFQELWNRQCLVDIFARAKELGLKGDYDLRFIGDSWGGIAVAAAVRRPWVVKKVTTHKNFPDEVVIKKRRARTRAEKKDREDDEVDLKITRFSRTMLQLTLAHESASKLGLEVFCVHLKAKLQTNLDKEEAAVPAIARNGEALGAAISTVRRTAEAAALRAILNKAMNGNVKPVAVMGDFNDGLLSNTLSIVTGQPPYQLFQAAKVSMSKRNIAKRDGGLYSAAMLQQYHSLRDVYYSHNFDGVVEMLDHVLVSEQFYDHSPNRLWSFRSTRIFNDHVDEHDPREKDMDKSMSDHGVVKAHFVYEGPPARR